MVLSRECFSQSLFFGRVNQFKNPLDIPISVCFYFHKIFTGYIEVTINDGVGYDPIDFVHPVINILDFQRVFCALCPGILQFSKRAYLQNKVSAVKHKND
ncbi:MAG TPA: hypothetical protein P5260_19030 [Candidatus Competibacter sp.]|nr:hypothetical protein [Candidatus Competibacter sp.]